MPGRNKLSRELQEVLVYENLLQNIMLPYNQ